MATLAAAAPPQVFRGIILALVVGTLAVYWPAATHDFVNYDDPDYVSNNPMVLRGLTWEGVRWAFTTNHIANWHPLTWLSHMLDCTLFGNRPHGPHLVNILLHLANSVTMFFLFHRLTGAVWRSGFVAALFAWHPLHVESVAWISERKDLLSTLFGLLALLAYERHARSGRRHWYWLMLAAFCLSLLAKPMLVTLPCVMLLLDYWPLGRLFPADAGARREGGQNTTGSMGSPGANWRKLFLEKMPLLLASLGISLATLHAQKAGGAMVSVVHFQFSDRLANAVFGYATYLKKTFWPTDLICPYFERHWSTAAFAWALTGLVAVTLLVVIGWRKRFLTVGWCWYLGTLVPVIGLVQVGSQAMADRYTYFPLLGIFVMVLWGGRELVLRWRLPLTGGAAVVGAALAGCLGLTAQQVHYWEDSESLFTHTIAVEPRNFVAEGNLGYTLIHLGRLPEAILHLTRALEINPTDPDSRNNLGMAFARAGRTQEAIECYRTNLANRPDHRQSLSGLADVLANAGRTNEALVTYEKRLALQPELGPDHAGYAALLERLGRTNEAEIHFRAGLRIEPASSLSHYNLAVFLSSQNRVAEADECFARAAGLEPVIFQIHRQWAVHLIRTGRPADAIAKLRHALQVFDESPSLLDLLARILAAHPDERLRNGRQAVELADQACKLGGGNNPRYLDTLAAGQAEAGNFSQAVATLQQALELIPGERHAPLRSGLQSRLALYRRNTPFRDANEWLVGN